MLSESESENNSDIEMQEDLEPPTAQATTGSATLVQRQAMTVEGTYHIILFPKTGPCPPTDSLSILALAHPGGRAKHKMLFGMTPEGNILFELRDVKSTIAHTSWALGEQLLKAGRTLIATPFDVKYFYLAYLSGQPPSQLQSGKFYSAEDIISSVTAAAECEALRSLLTAALPNALETFCDSKASPFAVEDPPIYGLSKSKVITWLAARAKALAAVPQFVKVLGEGAKASPMASAVGVLCDYVADHWREALCESLGGGLTVQDTRKGREKGKSSSSHFEARVVMKRPADTTTAPASKNSSAPAAKRPKGVPDIRSFFKKKEKEPEASAGTGAEPPKI